MDHQFPRLGTVMFGKNSPVQCLQNVNDFYLFYIGYRDWVWDIVPGSTFAVSASDSINGKIMHTVPIPSIVPSSVSECSNTTNNHVPDFSVGLFDTGVFSSWPSNISIGICDFAATIHMAMMAQIHTSNAIESKKLCLRLDDFTFSKTCLIDAIPPGPRDSTSKPLELGVQVYFEVTMLNGPMRGGQSSVSMGFQACTEPEQIHFLNNNAAFGTPNKLLKRSWMYDIHQQCLIEDGTRLRQRHTMWTQPDV